MLGQQREPNMTKSLLKFFRRTPEVVAAPDAQALIAMNARVQRMLALHSQTKFQPVPLPEIGKAA